MRHNTRLIAIDIDGTLLRSDGTISREDSAGINAAKDAGIHIALVSGRNPEAASLLAAEMGVDAAIISCNGAYILKSPFGKAVYERPLMHADALALLDFCEENKCKYIVFVPGAVHRPAKDEELHWDSVREDFVGVRVDESLCRLIDGAGQARLAASNALKIVLIEHDEQRLKLLKAQLQSEFDLSITSSCSFNIECMHSGVDKASGLEWYCKHLDISRHQVMAIGDGENDIPMLKWAGYGIAMGNARPHIRELARHVTMDNNNNGVSHAIERWALNNNAAFLAEG